jgi:preprotein translocase subunit YajC
MIAFLAWLPLLAADEQPAQPAPGGGLTQMLFPFVMIAIVFYFLMIRPQQRQQKQREELLSSVKKNDKVVTIGGIIGTVANISQDGKEVTLKVDDETRIRFQRSAIHAVIRDEVTTPDAAKAAGDKPA